MTNRTGPDPHPTLAERTSTRHDDQAPARTELAQLADALTRHGCHATVITPPPYLALHLPGATAPYMIYSSGGHYWWHAPQDIAPASQATRAAELITWDCEISPTMTPRPPVTPPQHRHPEDWRGAGSLVEERLDLTADQVAIPAHLLNAITAVPGSNELLAVGCWANTGFLGRPLVLAAHLPAAAPPSVRPLLADRTPGTGTAAAGPVRG